MSKSYANKTELRDGAVMLYQKPAAKRPIWYYRIHVRGMQGFQGEKLKYDERSTGETDLDEAKRVALDRHDDLKSRVRSKRPVKAITFADLYELWWAKKSSKLDANHRAKGRAGVTVRIGWFEKQSQRYWLPYFGSQKVEDMTQAFIDGYWDWRMAYWSNATDKERERFPNHAVKPSKKTLEMEQGSLGEVFTWGNAMKLFNYQPIIRNPYSRQGIASERRASFDAAEWTQLASYLDDWAFGRGKTDNEPGARINSRHLYHRQLLRLFIHWIESTGMRPGEVLLLKHEDVKLQYTSKHRQRILKIHVSPHTKTGARVVTGMPATVACYMQLSRLTNRIKPDDWLFCDQEGKQAKGFFKTLPNMLNEIGLLTDKEGKRRSAYSFRHLYAESRFRDIGINPRAYDLIGTNMGTSRQMLEAYYVRRGITLDEDALIENKQLRTAAEGRFIKRTLNGSGLRTDKIRSDS